MDASEGTGVAQVRSKDRERRMSSNPSSSLDDAMQKAVACHKAGQLQEAERLYRAILRAHPEHPDANHNLGVLARQAGQLAAGLPYFRAALTSNPSHEQYALSYADALLANGQATDALTIIQAATQRGTMSPAAESLRKRAEQAVSRAGATGAAPAPTEMNRLVALFNAGHFIETESQAHQLLGKYPHAGNVWNALGASLHAQGKDAVHAFRKAIEYLPNDAEAHNNLGSALKGIGKLDEALASFQRALAIKPDFAEAHYNLGNTLDSLGRLDDAVASYRRAVQIKPDFADAHNNLGLVLIHLARPDEAVASCRRALEIKPDFAEAHNNLGKSFKDLGQLDDAVANCLRALEIKPDYAEAHSNLGLVLKDMGRLDNAVASCRRALAIKPDFAEAHNNLGIVLKDLGRLDDALASYSHALEIKPDYAEAHSNLGIVMKDLGRLDDAVASYRRALATKSDLEVAHNGLLFLQNYLSDQSSAMLLAEARRFGDLVARKAQPYTHWPNIPDPEKCLRVGLVSGDLRNHPVGYFVDNVLAALASHAAGRIELIAYSCNVHSDSLTERIKTYCHGWHSALGLTDEGLARKIRDDGIDILIDLAGHTAHNRLPMFAWKPAPVQASWLGYFATTGVAAIDYLIADPWTVPEGEETHFTETIQRLPEIYYCFTAPEVDVCVSALPSLANGHITFGCFNNLTKMNDAVVALWARVLHAVPDSRLFLKSKQLSESSVRASTLRRFAHHGIAEVRLVLEGASPRAEYLAAYNRVDIALDPFPYPGGTTSFEALWMGVPILTLVGDRFLSHVGESIMHNAGLPDWIAADGEEYVARAVSHSRDLPRLAALRERLRQQVLASPLFDARRFAGHFEAALRSMWEQWCDRHDGQPPQLRLSNTAASDMR